ncbi:2TM domain-containing protein [Flavobacterium quisquiliarum]|uniref:2TM domain-containing protein n=1 Tax=Flavobacterium quisquiliarum TaxID=1834436 RepID=A0ABV8W863_9FLAO|nr:2TM domain-containing protein [Flavobacterium quisquiliarum]MBW1654750.1 histidine kinase [Flavobacterium quisquiliarum]NWL00171.1 histidine kinase [Flavobacterium collinsii]
MEKDFTEADRYYDAQKKVKEIREFYEHLTVYVLVNPIVIVVNLMTSPGYLWFLWCLMGWGMAIVLHGLKVFSLPPFFNKKWEERKIKEIMDKEKNRKSWE